MKAQGSFVDVSSINAAQNYACETKGEGEVAFFSAKRWNR